jgi:hypothetical protein
MADLKCNWHLASPQDITVTASSTREEKFLADILQLIPGVVGEEYMVVHMVHMCDTAMVVACMALAQQV